MSPEMRQQFYESKYYYRGAGNRPSTGRIMASRNRTGAWWKLAGRNISRYVPTV